MEGLELIRKWAAMHNLRQAGLRVEHPRSTVAQQRTAHRESDILSLPQDTRNWLPLQDADTGELFFMMDMHALDGGNPIR